MSAFNKFKANVPVMWSPNLYITLVRGMPGTRKLHRRTLEALRLGKCNRTVMRWNTPTVRGMIQQVKRMVVVETEEMYNARKQKEANHRALCPPLVVNHHSAPTDGLETLSNTRYKDVKIYFVSPDVVKMKDDIKDHLTSKGVEWEESADLMAVASKCDIVYQTRIQKERFGERTDLYEAARGKYIVDRDVLDVMQKHTVVMHPLPRLDEITVNMDADPRAAYFRQAKNGLYIRMALLKVLLLGW